MIPDTPAGGSQVALLYFYSYIAALVIVAGDASENTKKKFRDMCEFYEVPIYFYKDKDTLGHAMGKEFRASLAILDEGFAKEITKQMKTEDNTVA